MTDFESALRAALQAVPHPGFRERQLQRHLDRPDSARKAHWLARCESVAITGTQFADSPSILDWLKANWPAVLQAFLSLAALILPLLLATDDEMLHAEVNATVGDALATGWTPGREIILALMPKILDQYVLPTARKIAADSPVPIQYDDAALKAYLLAKIQAGQQ